MAITDPTDIGSLELWADHNSPNLTSTDGGAVSTWEDRSGNARHLDTTTSAPTWDDSETAVDFTSSQYIDDGGDGGADWSSWTIAVCVKRVSSSSGIIFGSGNATPEYSMNNAWFNDVNAWRIYYPNAESYGDVAPSTSEFEVWFLTGNTTSGDVAFYKNNSLDRSTSHSFGTDQSDTLFRIGWTSSDTQPVKIRGICLYKKEFTSTERTDFYNWANNNWLSLGGGAGTISPSTIEQTQIHSPTVSLASGGGSAAAPDDIADLALWCDIDSPNLASTNGAAVTTWEDQSSVGRDLTSTSSNLAPSWNSSENAVHFDSVENALYTSTGHTLYNNWSIVMAVKRISPNEGVLCAEYNGFDPELNCLSATTGGIRCAHNTEAFDATSAISTADFELWIVTGNASTNTIDFYRNNTLVTSVSGAVVSTSDSGFIIGSNTNPQSAYWRAVLVYKHVLSSSERGDLQTYASNNGWVTSGGGGGTGTTAPGTISDLVFWADYRDISHNDHGTHILSWPDRSSIGRTVTETNAAQAPTWNATEEALIFDGLDDGLESSTGGATYSAYTVVIVGRRRGPVQNSLVVSELNYNWHISVKNDGYLRQTQNGDITDSTVKWSVAAYEVWYCTVDAATDNITWYRNNVEVGTQTRTGLVGVADGGIRIGSNGNPENMFMRAVLVYKKVLTATERQELYEYAQTAWLGFTTATQTVSPTHFTSGDVNSPFVEGGGTEPDADQIVGLTLHVDYRDLTSSSHGDPISTWTDRSDAQRDLTEPNADRQPTWDADEVAVLFRASACDLTTAVANGTSDSYTIVLVGKSFQSWAAGFLWHENNHNMSGSITTGRRYRATASAGAIFSDSIWAWSEHEMWIVTINGPQNLKRLYYNGHFAVQDQTRLIDDSIPDRGWTLGSQTNSENFWCRVFQVYNRILSDSEISLLGDYANENWLGAGDGGTQGIATLKPGTHTTVYKPTLTVESIGSVQQTQWVTETEVFQPTITGGKPPVIVPKSVHSNDLGSDRFGPHDRFIYPIIITSTNQTLIFHDTSVGGSYRIIIPQGVYYAHYDSDYFDTIPSIYRAIELELEQLVSGVDFWWVADNLDDSEFEASGLALQRDIPAQRWGFIFSHSLNTFDQRIIGGVKRLDNADRVSTGGSYSMTLPVDYGGVWRSPHRASDKRRLPTQRTVNVSSDQDPDPFVLAWEVNARRRFKYHHLTAAHVYAWRSFNEELAAEAGLVIGGHNAFEDLWTNAGDIICVHDQGDGGLEISDSGALSFEILRPPAGEEAQSFAEIVEPVEAGERYNLEFIMEIIESNDIDGDGYRF